MSLKYSLISLLAVILGFLGGFLLANALNRSDMDKLKLENEKLASQLTENEAKHKETTLSDEEIRSRIEEADKNPTDFKFNKGLGIALYHYGASKQDDKLINEALRLLERANSLENGDNDILIALGNGYFDLGYLKKGDQNFDISRKYYQESLKHDPKNPAVITDYGLTYFLDENPDLTKAISELEKANEIDPKYEKALQFLIQAYWKQRNNAKAGEYLDKLKEVSPNNPSISELMSMLTRDPETN